MQIRTALKRIPFFLKGYRRIKAFWSGKPAQNTPSFEDIDYVCTDADISLIHNRNSKANFFFPYASRSEFSRIQLKILNNGFDLHLRKKYSHPECSIRKGDTVIDCGGFVGGFSVAASKMGAENVFYIEPTPLSRRCAELNFRLHGCDRISVLPYALGEVPGHATLNLSRSGADNSLLAPDAGATGETVNVELTTIDKVAERGNLDPQNTFAKIEAEGFEVEIVKGMKDFLPRALAVDVTPERSVESPRDEIAALLSQKGYAKIYHTERCLFAVRGEHA